MAERLTEALIRRLALQPQEATAIVFDSEVPGLGVRLYRSGGKSFVFDYRLRGRQHRHVLGKVGAWSLDAARQHARVLRVDVDKGIDPFGKRGSSAPQWTLADAWARYERDYLPVLAPKTALDLRVMWRDLILPSWPTSPWPISPSPTLSGCIAPLLGPRPGEPDLRDAAAGAQPRS